MHSCALSPHDGSGFISGPSDMGAHGSMLGAAMARDGATGTPEQIRPGASAPSEVQAPSHAGESQAIAWAPIPGHFAADTCICSRIAQPEGAHEQAGQIIGEGRGSPWSVAHGAGAVSGQGGGWPGPIQNMERSSNKADFQR